VTSLRVSWTQLYDVPLADLLALGQTAEHLVEGVEAPLVGHWPHVDHQSGPVQLLDPDLTEVAAGLAVVTRRVDVGAGVHVRLDQHRTLGIAVMGRDVGDLDRLELRPGGHPIPPGLGKVDKLHPRTPSSW
jgi:hypothetical protein